MEITDRNRPWALRVVTYDLACRHLRRFITCQQVAHKRRGLDSDVAVRSCRLFGNGNRWRDDLGITYDIICMAGYHQLRCWCTWSQKESRLVGRHFHGHPVWPLPATVLSDV